MSRFYCNHAAATIAANTLRVYAQPTRLMILSCLLDAERNVGEIGAATGIGQPALSQQLAELRRANLVSTRKQVRQVWYKLANAQVSASVRSMEDLFAEEGPQS